jgi:flagellar motor switch protein FliN/FliY
LSIKAGKSSRLASEDCAKFAGGPADNHVEARRQGRRHDTQRTFHVPARKLKEEFGPERASDVHAACQAATPRAARAFARAFGAGCQLAVGKPQTLGPLGLGNRASGAGLVVLLPIGHRAALLLISESTGILPAWYDRLNATQAGKLSALAQELGKTLLPRKFAAKDCAAAAVTDLNAALVRGACAREAALVPLSLAIDDREPGPAWLVWPIDDPASVFDAAGSPVPASTFACANGEAEYNARSQCAPAHQRSQHEAPRGALEADTAANYRRKLLGVKVPLSVTLVAGKQAVGRVLAIAPGAILRFDKPCTASLDLEAGGRRIAQGTCVQFGNRLGLLVTSPGTPQDVPAGGSLAR